MPFARQCFGDNCRYQDDHTTPHRAQITLDFLQQGSIIKMEQPAKSSDCNPTEHIWDEFCCANTNIDSLTQNVGELRQALLDEWGWISAERPQCLITSMPRRLTAIIIARGRNTQYWPGIHKSTPTSSTKHKSLFDQIYHNYLLMKFRYVHAANFSNIKRTNGGDHVIFVVGIDTKSLYILLGLCVLCEKKVCLQRCWTFCPRL